MKNISNCPTSQCNKLRDCHWPDSASSTSCAGLGRSSQGALAQITWLLRFFYRSRCLLFLRSPLPSWLVRLANEGEVVPPFGDGPVISPYWSWIDWISETMSMIMSKNLLRDCAFCCPSDWVLFSILRRDLVPSRDPSSCLFSRTL